jgi:signal transduction histidine kinase/CheY-like chemotaxis protein
MAARFGISPAAEKGMIHGHFLRRLVSAVRKRWSTERKIVLGFAGVLLVLIVVAGVSVWLTMALLNELAAVSVHNDVLQAIREFRNTVAQTGSAARLYAADQSEKNYADFSRQVNDTRERLRVLTQLVGPQSLEINRLQQIETILQGKIERTRPGTPPQEIQQMWSPDSFAEFRELVLKLDQEEQYFLRQRNTEARQKALLAMLTIGLASVLAIVVVGGAAGVILRDLSARRRAEEELERARLAAEAASVAKSAFLANMSHELRTPLTSIMGYADLLLAADGQGAGQRVGQGAGGHGRGQGGAAGEPGGGRREDYVRTMRRSGEHLLTLINDILDVSKIEAGRMSVESVECRLVDMLADVQSMMRSRASEKGIEFTVGYESAIPERILTDPTRLRQILMNLVGNAVKFTDRGSVRVAVRFTPEAASAAGENGTSGRMGTLEVDVIDTGVGIAAEQQAFLFQPFAQADVSTTRRFGGTGLGLSISRRLAEMLGGDIGVQSVLGAGSTFRLKLETGIVEGRFFQPREAQEAVAVVSREYDSRQLGLRVLLAEDGEESREVIGLHLQNAGCFVTAATDGAEAHRLATEAAVNGKPFDVVLMDMQMPVMDGYTATSKLRAEGYQGPIIALTAHAMKEDRERCLRVGCDDYAAKPVDIPGLLSLMERLCGRAGEAGAAMVNARLRQDPALRKLRQKFCEGLDMKVEELLAHGQAGRTAELAAGAHRLAGAAGAFGFEEITSAAKKLEAATRKGDAAAMRAEQEALQDACRRAREEIIDPAQLRG